MPGMLTPPLDELDELDDELDELLELLEELLDELELLLEELDVDELELDELLELAVGSVAMPVQEKPLSTSLQSRVMT